MLSKVIMAWQSVYLFLVIIIRPMYHVGLLLKITKIPCIEIKLKTEQKGIIK